MAETMIVGCPSCGVRFIAPVDQFRPTGRTVRCSECRHTWRQNPESVENHEEIMDSSADAATTRQSAAPQESSFETPVYTKPRSGGRWLLYGLAALLLAALGAYLGRDALAERFPSLAPHLNAYADGVHDVGRKILPTATTLRIENVVYDFASNDGGETLLVSADVVNEGEDDSAPPDLAIRAFDDAGAILLERRVAPGSGEPLAPDASLNYLMTAPRPNGEMARIVVDFAKEK